MNFIELNLNESIVNALHQKGYAQPTPIQEKAIPVILQGKDIFGCAQTGTGKTAAFALPILQRLQGKGGKGIKALILAPTRELALQIEDSFKTYGNRTGLRHAVIFGGVSQHTQVKA